MAALNRILPQFARTLGKLDGLIAKLELNTGSAVRLSPFQSQGKANELLAFNTEEPKGNVEKEKPVAAVPQKENKKAQKKEAADTNKKPAEKNPKTEHEEEKSEEPHGGNKNPQELLDLYSQVDIRVGKIIECWKHPESEKLYCEKIDIGEEVREIASGLRQFVNIEDMSGLVIIMANLKAKKLAGFNSNGMVLCASNNDHTKVELLRPHPNSKVGERVTLDLPGFEKLAERKEPVLNPKKKVAETAIPHFKTDANLAACFDGKKMITSAGTILAQTLSNSHIS